MNNILVSIIVPVYGTEAYLPTCIDSICSQTHSYIEIILVDDQSPDRCPEICESFSQRDSRIRVIHQENKGVSGARNTGLRSAKGDYFMFVDSDDAISPDAVETLLHDIVYYGADIVSATKSVGNVAGKLIDKKNKEKTYVKRGGQMVLQSLLGQGETNSACAKLFRSSSFSDVFFVEGQNVNEDGFFLFQCFMKEPVFVQHNVPIYQYNFRSGSGSRDAFSEKYLSMLYFCDRKKELIAEHYPHYMEQAYNMEVRTNVQLLDVLCRTTDRKYEDLQRKCVNTVCRLYKYHHPINKHHKLVAWAVKHGLYPIYKWAVRIKYFR